MSQGQHSQKNLMKRCINKLSLLDEGDLQFSGDKKVLSDPMENLVNQCIDKSFR